MSRIRERYAEACELVDFTDISKDNKVEILESILYHENTPVSVIVDWYTNELPKYHGVMDLTSLFDVLMRETLYELLDYGVAIYKINEAMCEHDLAYFNYSWEELTNFLNVVIQMDVRGDC